MDEGSHEKSEDTCDMRHRLHALCPYFAMFPESFAETWIDRLSNPGEIVLDPFSGRGTTAFQSMLMGRRPIACDVNDVAYCVTRAKTQAPALSALRRRLTLLERDFQMPAWSRRASKMPEFFQFAYARKTLAQVLYLRDKLKWKTSGVDCMIAGLMLGALHGESEKSPSYLSNQMPRTISTKPAYSVRFWKDHGFAAPERDAFELLRKQATFRYESAPPSGDAWVLHQDMRQLAWIADQLPGPIGLVVTSPPYLDVTNFEEDQWLRLWFLGGPPYPTRGRISRDDRYERPDAYWGFIADMWRMLGSLVAKNGHVVIRMGGRGIPPEEMVTKLSASSQFARRSVKMIFQTTSALKGRQTDAFLKGTRGCLSEIDCHFQFRN
jgi:DNA methylase